MEPYHKSWWQFFFVTIAGISVIVLYFLPLILVGSTQARGQETTSERDDSFLLTGSSAIPFKHFNKPATIVNRPGLGTAETLEICGEEPVRECVRIVPEPIGLRIIAVRIPILNGRDSMRRNLNTRQVHIEQARRPKILNPQDGTIIPRLETNR